MDEQDWREMDEERQADNQVLRDLGATKNEEDDRGLLEMQQAAYHARLIDDHNRATRDEDLRIEAEWDLAAEEAAAEGSEKQIGGGIGVTWRIEDEPALTPEERLARGIPDWVPPGNELFYDAANDSGRLTEIRLLLDDQFRAQAAIAARAVNMGVLHEAGCEAPGRTVSSFGGFSWTITPENALNDSIKRVADGRGGLIMKCIECKSTTPLDRPPPAEMTAYARERIALISGAVRNMRAQHLRITKQAVATTIEVDRDTLAGWIKSGWVAWPPD